MRHSGYRYIFSEIFDASLVLYFLYLFVRVKESDEAPAPEVLSVKSVASPPISTGEGSAALLVAELRAELVAQERLVADLTGQKLAREAELEQQLSRAAELETRLARIQQEADCKVTLCFAAASLRMILLCPLPFPPTALVPATVAELMMPLFLVFIQILPYNI